MAEGLYKIWPEKHLTPGQYAVVEYTEGKVNIQIWDFAYSGRQGCARHQSTALWKKARLFFRAFLPAITLSAEAAGFADARRERRRQ